MAPALPSSGATDRSFFQCMTLLLASGIGSGVLVIPRAMASVGYIPAAIYFLIGALVSASTTWILSRAVLEVRRLWIEEDLKRPLHSSDRRHHLHLALEPRHSPTTWKDMGQDDGPASPISPTIRRSTSFRDQITRVGPSYGDLVERATPNCPWVSSTLDCVLFLHNTLALTVYFLFVAESYERLGYFWPLNFLSPDLCHILTICWTAMWGCFLSTMPTVGGLARFATVSPFVLWLMMGSIWFEWLDNWHPRNDESPPVEAYTDDWLEKSPSVFCIAVFASFWHTNCVAVARELRDPSSCRYFALSFSSALLLGFLYYFLAFGGYCTFGAALLEADKPTIVKQYGQMDPFFIAVRLGLAFSLTIAIPLNVFPIRESVENMKLFQKLPTALRRRLLGPATDPRMQATREHEIVGVTLVLIPMILSLLFRDVVKLITILGGSLVSLMMIVYPCIVLRMICSSTLVGQLVWWTALILGTSLATFLALASWGFVGEKI